MLSFSDNRRKSTKYADVLGHLNTINSLAAYFYFPFDHREEYMFLLMFSLQKQTQVNKRYHYKKK